MFDRLNTIVRYIILWILLFPFAYIVPFIPAKLYFWILSFHFYVYLLYRYLILNNDFDDITCSECWYTICEYDNYCFHCWLENNLKKHV